MSSFKILALAAVLATALGTSTGAQAALVSVTGSGVQVPDNNPAGISVDINVTDTRLIRASGNNITLTLFNFQHHFLYNLSVTLEHIGSGAGAQTVFDQVLSTTNHATGVRFDGDYAFNSGASTTVRDGIDPIYTTSDVLPPGTYRPTLADDDSPSELSSAWNGESVAGIWRLHLADLAFFATTNADWRWQLDIEVQDSTSVPEPATLSLLLAAAAAGSAGAWRRRKLPRQ